MVACKEWTFSATIAYCFGLTVTTVIAEVRIVSNRHATQIATLRPACTCDLIATIADDEVLIAAWARSLCCTGHCLGYQMLRILSHHLLSSILFTRTIWVRKIATRAIGKIALWASNPGIFSFNKSHV